MNRHMLLTTLALICLSVAGVVHPQVQAEGGRPFIRVFYRWDREWEQGPFQSLFEAKYSMNHAYEQGDHDVRIVSEPLMDDSGEMAGVQYYVQGVAREKVQSRDFTSREEAKRFYDFKRQAGFKVAHKIFQ